MGKIDISRVKTFIPTRKYMDAIDLNFDEVYLGKLDELTLQDTVFDDLRVPVTTARRGSTNDPDWGKVLDDGSGSTGLFAELFSPTAEEELFFAVQMPHGWKQGTTIYPHVHWSPVANGSAGDVVSWGLEYSVAKIGATMGASTLIYGNAHITDETLVADSHYLTAIGSGISMASIDSVSAMILCRIFRDATGAGLTDDYASDAALFEVDFHYEIDALGSRDEYTK